MIGASHEFFPVWVLELGLFRPEARKRESSLDEKIVF